MKKEANWIDFSRDWGLRPRANILKKHVFDNMVHSSSGEITKETFKNARRVLDIGCGLGSLKLAMEFYGFCGEIVGTDLYDARGEGHEDVLDQYKTLFFGNIRKNGVIEKLHSHNFDLVFGLLMPKEVLNHIMRKKDDFNLLPGAKIILASEIDVYPQNGFEQFWGRGATYNFLVYTKH